MSSWVKVGAKCVCTHTGKGGYGDENFPIPDKIYTIREVLPPFRGNLHIRLFEVVNIPRVYDAGGYDVFEEPSWSVTRFRPLVSQQDDIAMFKALIAPTPELVVMPDLEHMGSD